MSKRTASQYDKQQTITKFGTSYPRRPFKRVRVSGNGLVPYGRSQLYVQKPVGARGVTKGVDTNLVLTSLNDNTMSNTTNVIPINLIAAGTGSWNRVGRMVTMKSIRCRFNVTMTVTGTEYNDSRCVRYLIVYDRQPNGTLPKKSDILSIKNQDGTEFAHWNSMLNYDNMSRFQILKDDVITLNPPPRSWTVDIIGGSTDREPLPTEASTQQFVDFFLKLNHNTTYKSESTPATIADISTGALYFVAIADTPTHDVYSKTYVEEGFARLRYIDQ